MPTGMERVAANPAGGETVVAVMTFISNEYVPLTQSVAEAFAIQHSDAILAVGLTSDEAKQIATHWLSVDRLKKMEFHARESVNFARIGKKITGIVPPKLAAKDRAAAQETEEHRALAKKGVTLRPLLTATWDDLRSRLSAGKISGYLTDSDSGKIYKIASHEWNRVDADVAHVTGWFSVPQRWGRFVGPVALLRSEFQQMVIRDRAIVGSQPARGRRGPKGKYDWDEAKLVLTAELDRLGDFNELGQMDNWNCQARAEKLINDHFSKRGQHPSQSLVRRKVVEMVTQWRSRGPIIPVY